MKQRIFTLFAAISALVMASCSKDTTETVGYGKFAGGKLHITTSIAQTRTALNDHKLVWTDGDTFGIYYVDADGKTLGVAESPAYEEGKTDYTLEDVPAGTAYLCCVYPYDSYMDADQDDLSDLYIPLPYVTGSDETVFAFNNEYNPLAAKAAVNGDSVSVVFEQILSILEFNIYDTYGDGTEQLFGVGVAVGEDDINCGSGNPTVDFLTGDKPTVKTDGFYTKNVSASLNAEEGPELGTSKEDGYKAYLYVPKSTYSELTVTVDTDKNHSEVSGTGYTFKYTNVDLTCDGRTFNINLSALTTPLIEQITVSTLGPWSAEAYVKPADECVKYAVAVFPTVSTPDGNDMSGQPVTKGDGWDENMAKFISNAEISFETFNSKFGLLYYMVFTGEQTFDQLWFLYSGDEVNGEWTAPSGLRINDSVEEYTLAVYAVDADGNGQVHTAAFKPEAFASGSGEVTPTVAKTKNQKSDATATISADGASYVFYGYSNTLESTPTSAEVETMFTSNEMNTYFVEYKSAITLDFKKYGTNPYIVWAVAVDEKGAISSVVSETFGPVEDTGFDFSGTAKVTSFEGKWFIKGMPDQVDGDSNPVPTKWGNMEVTVEFSSNVNKFAIFDMDDVTWNLDSGNGTTYGANYTIQNIKEQLAANINSGKGENDNVFTVTGGTEMTISKYFYNNYDSKHHLYALALGNDGKFGSLVNLYNPEMPESAGDALFLSSDVGYEFTGTVYEYGDGPTDDSFTPGEPDATLGYWKETLTDKTPSEWLKFVDLSVEDEYISTKVSWDANADNSNVKYVYILYKANLSYISLEESVQGLVDAINELPYTPGKEIVFVDGYQIAVDRASAAGTPVVSNAANYGKQYDGDTTGRIWYTILVDNDGYLTLASVGYIKENETTPTIVSGSSILDISDYLNNK